MTKTNAVDHGRQQMAVSNARAHRDVVAVLAMVIQNHALGECPADLAQYCAPRETDTIFSSPWTHMHATYR